MLDISTVLTPLFIYYPVRGLLDFYTIKNSFREEERGEKKICY